MANVNLEPAYILHSKPYSDTSLIITFLTKNYGKINLIAKGCRRNKHKYKHLLQQFISILINFTQRGGLGTLISADLENSYSILDSNRIIYGMYVNELTYKVLSFSDSSPEIYYNYHLCISSLYKNNSINQILRKYEKGFLDAIGYGYDYKMEYNSNKEISEQMMYGFISCKGFLMINNIEINDIIKFKLCGKHILSINDNDFSHMDTCKVAKRIFQETINSILDSKTINTRNFFIAEKIHD